LAAKKNINAYVHTALDWLAPAPFRGKYSSFGNLELCTRKLLQVTSVSVFDACARLSHPVARLLQ